MFSRILVLAVAVVLLGAALASPALAGHISKGTGHGKGNGNGNGDTGGTTTTATLTVSPNPVPAYTEFAVTGSGFHASSPVYVSLTVPGAVYGFTILADASGNISFGWKSGGPGTYTIDARQSDGNKLVLMASISFSVV